MMRIPLLLLLFFATVHSSFAQELRYFIGFTDKANNTYSLEQPEEFLTQQAIDRRLRQSILLNGRDLPVSQPYIDSLRHYGINVIYTSRWLNAAVVDATEAQMAEIYTWDFVTELPYITRGISANEEPKVKLLTQHKWKYNPQDEELYGTSFNQIDMIGLDDMHELGYTGAGITIAIMDGGFRNTQLDPSLDPIVEGGRLLSTYDFVDNDESVYEDSEHGRRVFSIVGSYQEQVMIGSAYGASYHLFKTENVSEETRLEEVYWLIGAERADSLGVDIILSSLGYNLFDAPEDTYDLDEIDGNTTLVTVAADLAASTGMLVVTSAGNEGNDPWQKVTAPADADSVLSVGAVDENGIVTNFSSLGPTADDRLKPEVVAQGRSVVTSNAIGGTRNSLGTSFAAPLVAGFAAGLWEARPELTNMELIRVIKETASQAANPDNTLGYGLPNFQEALEYETITALDESPLFAETRVFPNPFSTQLSIAFPKEIVGQRCSVLLFNNAGKQILEQTFLLTETTYSLSMPKKLSSGIYILSVNSENNFKTFRIIKP